MAESANRINPFKANASTNNENPNAEIQRKANIPSGSKNRNKDLVDNIGEMIKIPEPQSPTACSIYRVPYRLRKWKEEAYTPSVISIGPFHRDKTRLKEMEERKVIYLKNFIKRTNLKLEDLVSNIRGWEESIRSCYAESLVQLESDDFVKMIPLDASFIVELFLKSYLGDWKSGDPIRETPLLYAVKFDLLLLENQLPLFVIEKLLEFVPVHLRKSATLIELTSEFFSQYNYQRKNLLASKLEIVHFMDLLRTFLLSSNLKRGNKECEWIRLYSATQLHKAGVKFKPCSSDRCCYLDIKFEKGVLEIPCLKLDDDTEAIVRNAMALEQTRYIENAIITQFFFILDFLINTTEDMNLLCDEKIMVNYLGDNKAARSMVNSLNKGIIWKNLATEYYDICEGLNKFYEDPWNSWMATLRHDYFRTPWRIASTIAAIILLVLTFIQTIFSIL